MTRARFRLIPATAAAVLLLTSGAFAQGRDGNFLDDLFSRGERQQQAPRGEAAPQGRGAPSNDPSDLTVRIDRLEGALRQLTGTLEQLQYQNQQLQMQVQQLQQAGMRGGPAPAPAPNAAPPVVQPQGQPLPGRRGDAFDPTQNPNAAGAPRALGSPTQTASAAPIVNDPPVGAPGGRQAGEPLDLNTLSGSAPPPQTMPPPQTPPRNVTTPNMQTATLPPSASPQDEYDLAYGYVLRKDYALAEQSFREFLRKNANDRLAPDAQYWMGEALYQQQRYRDAAESFLAVSTKHERASRAPDSLLRLGQSLAALNKKEAACATLAEVERKYPKASASVKKSVAAEQKRVHC